MTGARLKCLPEGFWLCKCGLANGRCAMRCPCGKARPFDPLPGGEIPPNAPGQGQEFELVKKERHAVRAMNKTEERFYRDIIAPQLETGCMVLSLPQALRLDFGDGTRYEPDFFAWVKSGATAGIVCYEVKGAAVAARVSWTRIGIERFRRAREKWPMIRFEMWVWKKGAWKREM